MLQPKRTAHRKTHKISFEGKAKGNKYVAFGEMGLVSTTGAWITGKQMEAARIVISKHLGKTGKMWTRIFPQMAVTRKPIGVRMGSGKGNVEWYTAVVKCGTVMFEIAGVPEDVMRDGLKKAGDKLSVACKIIKKGERSDDTRIYLPGEKVETEKDLKRVEKALANAEANKAKAAAKKAEPKKSSAKKAETKKSEKPKIHVSKLDASLEDVVSDKSKKVAKLAKQKEPIEIVGKTDDNDYVLADGKQLPREEVVREIDEEVNEFFVGKETNLLVTVHPKEDIVDYVRTKPNSKDSDNLSNLEEKESKK